MVDFSPKETPEEPLWWSKSTIEAFFCQSRAREVNRGPGPSIDDAWKGRFPSFKLHFRRLGVSASGWSRPDQSGIRRSRMRQAAPLRVRFPYAPTRLRSVALARCRFQGVWVMCLVKSERRSQRARRTNWPSFKTTSSGRTTSRYWAGMPCARRRTGTFSSCTR